MSTERPSWMDGGIPRVKSSKMQQVPFSPPSYAESTRPTPTTHRNVVIGITILAVLALFSTFFWVGIGLSLAISPVRGFDLFYLSGGRAIIGVIVGIIGTVGAWALTDSIVD